MLISGIRAILCVCTDIKALHCAEHALISGVDVVCAAGTVQSDSARLKEPVAQDSLWVSQQQVHEALFTF